MLHADTRGRWFDACSSVECRTQARGRKGRRRERPSTAEALLSGTGGRSPTRPGTERQEQERQQSCLQPPTPDQELHPQKKTGPPESELLEEQLQPEAP